MLETSVVDCLRVCPFATKFWNIQVRIKGEGKLTNFDSRRSPHLQVDANHYKTLKESKLRNVCSLRRERTPFVILLSFCLTSQLSFDFHDVFLFHEFIYLFAQSLQCQRLYFKRETTHIIVSCPPTQPSQWICQSKRSCKCYGKALCVAFSPQRK